MTVVLAVAVAILTLNLLAVQREILILRPNDKILINPKQLHKVEVGCLLWCVLFKGDAQSSGRRVYYEGIP